MIFCLVIVTPAELLAWTSIPLTNLIANCTSTVDVESSSFSLGMQGHLWTETVRSRDQMFSMIFPRMLALAERAWHKASWEDIDNKEGRDAEKARDWEKFANVLGYRELSRLDRIGVTYRVPPPGAR